MQRRRVQEVSHFLSNSTFALRFLIALISDSIVLLSIITVFYHIVVILVATQSNHFFMNVFAVSFVKAVITILYLFEPCYCVFLCLNH